MTKPLNVCAVVVAYNRKELLANCLNSMLRQTVCFAGICIIDNASTDGTPDLLLESGYIPNLPPKQPFDRWDIDWHKPVPNAQGPTSVQIHYVRLGSNVGCTAGFDEGMRKAFHQGYEWLVLTDDDGEFLEDTLAELSKFFDLPEIGCLCSKVVNADRATIQFNHRSFCDFSRFLIFTPLEASAYAQGPIKIGCASWTGLALHRRVIEAAGFPKREMFVYWCDIEYTLRIHAVTRILLIPESVMVHKNASQRVLRERRVLGKRYQCVPFDSLAPHYYMRRNIVWLEKKYTRNRALFWVRLLSRYIIYALGALLFENRKWFRLRFLTESYLDGLKGLFDNSKPTRMLGLP